MSWTDRDKWKKKNFIRRWSYETTGGYLIQCMFPMDPKDDQVRCEAEFKMLGDVVEHLKAWHGHRYKHIMEWKDESRRGAAHRS